MKNVDRQQLAKYRDAMDVAVMYFGLPRRFTLPEFISAAESSLGRTIELVPYPTMPWPFTGTMLATKGVARIVFRTDLTVAQTQLIICHELVHLLRGHQGLGLDELHDMIQQTRAALPDESDAFESTTAVRICGRTFSSHPDEFEAEYSGTYLASKLLPSDSFLQSVLNL